MNSIDHVIEAAFTTEQRKRLPSSAFGIPELRKYPLTDKSHVMSAISYFHKAPEEHKLKLARRIARKAKEFGIEISPDSDVARCLAASKTRN